MANIDKIILTNFKAFYGDEIIEVNGKNLLIYGENGSGKSSIYWALYTLMQSSTKNEEQIYKYFSPDRDENLVNINYVEPQVEIDPSDGVRLFPLAEILESSVEVILTAGTSFKISYKGIETTDLELLKNLNRFSDFISHRLLINFYNFRNSKEINLWEVFVRDMFPFLKTNRGNSDKTLSDELNEIDNTQPFINLRTDEFQLTSSQRIQNTYNTRISEFNNDVRYWINDINTEVNQFYDTHFKNLEEKEIKISLKYDEPLKFDKDFYQYYKGKKRNYKYVGFNSPHISLKIEIEKDDGTYTPILKPQSYFNEAKLTSIGLAVRFTLLLEFIRPDFDGKFLALDDLLVSLDMSNRGKVLDIILNEFAPKYKIYLFTHEMEFFNYCKFKISQKNQRSEWKVQEIYSDNDKKKPVIIDSEFDYFEKARTYFNAKDYVAASVYLRKDIEHFIKIRIPDVFKKNTDNEFHTLDHYWNLFVERYQALGINIDTKYHHWFKQSKLVILNPSAHANISQQIYKVELENAFKFREEIEMLCPINEQILVIPEKTRFVFKHPSQNYIFEFYFKTDFLCARHQSNFESILPKAIIQYFSFNDIEFWNFRTSRRMEDIDIERHIKNKDVDFNVMLKNLKRESTLAITDDMFFKNTFIKSSELSLNEILEKFKAE